VNDDSLLNVRDVIAMTALARATIYRRIAAHEFPQPAKIGGSARWSRREVSEWIEAQLAARKAA
jgi:prophage regulatory protein